MARFDRVYDPDQIEAFCHAYLDRKIRPMRKVIELAAAGQLLTRDGRETRPFEANPHTFAGYVARERRRRRGAPRGSALDRPDDMLEGLRKRLIAVADQELTFAERQKRGKRDVPHLSQIARLIREANALPKPGENRSRQPGQRDDNGRMVDGASKGIAGKMLAAHRRESTATERPSQTQTPTETTDAAQHQRDSAHKNETDDERGSTNSDSATSDLPAQRSVYTGLREAAQAQLRQ